LPEVTSVLAATVAAIVTRSSLADPHVVPAGSMLLTVQVGVVISTLAYGLTATLPVSPTRLDGGQDHE
jgi:signal peptidase I